MSKIKKNTFLERFANKKKKQEKLFKFFFAFIYSISIKNKKYVESILCIIFIYMVIIWDWLLTREMKRKNQKLIYIYVMTKKHEKRWNERRIAMMTIRYGVTKSSKKKLYINKPLFLIYNLLNCCCLFALFYFL